eukprot:3009780-Rhodomonas_salina.2
MGCGTCIAASWATTSVSARRSRTSERRTRSCCTSTNWTACSGTPRSRAAVIVSSASSRQHRTTRGGMKPTGSLSTSGRHGAQGHHRFAPLFEPVAITTQTKLFALPVFEVVL